MLLLIEDFLVFLAALAKQRVRVGCQANNLTRDRNSVVGPGLYGQVGLGSGVNEPSNCSISGSGSDKENLYKSCKLFSRSFSLSMVAGTYISL